MRESGADFLFGVNGYRDHLLARRVNKLTMTALASALLYETGILQSPHELTPRHYETIT